MIAVIILLIFLGILILKICNQKPNYLPPGEWGIPLIGYMPFRGEKAEEMVKRLQAKHGKIFCVKMGVRIFVYISDYSVIKTTFGKDAFSGRTNLFSWKILHYFKNEGIILADGHPWSTNRRFTIKAFKEFGMGKSKLEEIVEMEVIALVKDWNSKVNLPTKIDWSLNVAVLNVTWGIIAGKRFELHQEEIQKFAKLVEEIAESFIGSAQILNLHPWLIPYLPEFVMKWLKIDHIERIRDAFTAYILEHIEEHKKTFDNMNPRDYIDLYLRETVEVKSTNHSNLIATIFDLFCAGAETTSSSIKWFIYFMMKYPEIQRKIQNEIDTMVPVDRFPSLEDKENLPYLEASIYESLRLASLIPLGLPHGTVEDGHIGEFKIPKGTIILACIDLCHHSSQYWENPYEFYPEHFLNEYGKFFIPKEGFLPFSVGRRQCLGESLAKTSLFLFIAAILQQFSLCEPEEENDVTVCCPSILNVPAKFKVLLKKRNF